MPAKAKEVKEETTEVSFEYDGETYTYDKTVLDDVDVLEAVDRNQLTVLVQAVVGAEQYQKFKEKRRTISELAEFSKVCFKAAGSDLGK